MKVDSSNKNEVRIGEFLKRFRKEHGLTQQQVADDLGIFSQMYQRYEWDKTLPSVAVIVALAKKYGVSADYLLGLSDEPKPAGDKPLTAPVGNEELVRVAEAFNELLQKVIANEKAAGGQ